MGSSLTFGLRCYRCLAYRPWARWMTLASAAALATTSSIASDLWMTNERLRAAFAGQTIVGQYVDGREFRETYTADGSLDYADQARARRLTGHWSIIEHRFCTIYRGDTSGGCFRVHQASANCFEFYFETRTEAEVRGSTLRNPTWTARAWRENRISTCEERPLV